jgi:putative heme-binding domain-containing protein
MGHTDSPAGKTLESLLAPHHPSEIQLAAVRAIARSSDSAAAAALLDRDRWLAFTPDIREAVLSALLSDENRTPVLLDALEKGAVAASSVGPSRRTRLMNHRNAAIQRRARSLFAGVESDSRMQVYKRMRESVLDRPADASNGKHVFAARCATCHTFDGTGAAVGPDLSGIRNQPADAILLHTLAPDYEITPGYQAYVVETRDGRTLTGRLESEAPNSVTLRNASAESHVVLRSQIVSMAASTSSLMPGDLELTMSEQDLADLIAYLKTSAQTQKRDP